MKVRDVMTSNPITVNFDQTVGEVMNIFIQNKIDSAPVTDKNRKLIGLFTKSHIYRVIKNHIDLETKVEAMMTKDVITGFPDDEFNDLVNPFVPRLPVVDENGLVVGIVTSGDIARASFNSYISVSLERDTIINSAHNVIISINERGMIKVWNASAERLLGQKSAEVIGKSITEVLPESDLLGVIDSGTVQPLRKVQLNGRLFLSNRSPILKDGEVVGAVAVLQDVSELENVTKELGHFKELNRELDAIIDSSFDGLYIADGNGLTLRLNQAYERITGLKTSEFLGKSVFDIEKEGLVSESVSALVLKKRKQVTINQEMRSGKTTLSTGSPVFDEAGNIFRVVCNVRDITELNFLKQKLEEVENLSQHYENQLRTLRMQYAVSNKIVCNSKIMKDFLETVIRLAGFDTTILITGESGTGKELIAEAIHNNSIRRDNSYIKVNCGAIPENLLESELFGYEHGAFTGAKEGGKLGMFQIANKGTIFLDEIADLSFNLQVKLLRVLQNREITRVGSTKPISIDVRIITGTNRNLLEMVEKKQFREDLYYRLNVVPINVPPLRERKDDIPALVNHFVDMFNHKHHITKKFSQEVVESFLHYDWPGNVRELENLIERIMVISTQNLITSDELPSYYRDAIVDRRSEIFVSGIIPLQDAVAEVEKQILEKAYAQYRTTRQIAKQLQVNASTIVRKAAKYGITSPDSY